LALILRANNGIFVEDADFFLKCLVGPIFQITGFAELPCPTLIHALGMDQILALRRMIRTDIPFGDGVLSGGIQMSSFPDESVSWSSMERTFDNRLSSAVLALRTIHQIIANQ